MDTTSVSCMDNTMVRKIRRNMTTQQIRVLGLHARGLSPTDIALRLGVSVMTAHNHLSGIVKNNRVSWPDLIPLAKRLGLTETPLDADQAVDVSFGRLF